MPGPIAGCGERVSVVLILWVHRSPLGYLCFRLWIGLIFWAYGAVEGAGVVWVWYWCPGLVGGLCVIVGFWVMLVVHGCVAWAVLVCGCCECVLMFYHRGWRSLLLCGFYDRAPWARGHNCRVLGV